VPYTLVIGEKEIAGEKVTPRIRKDMAVNEQASTITMDEFLGTVANEAKSRIHKSSL
jgi:threonyl-tRNA synthetase